MTVNAELEYTLEDLLDKHGLRLVLSSLENVCHEKAEHIQTNWQDKLLAAKWTKAAKRIGRALNFDMVT